MRREYFALILGLIATAFPASLLFAQQPILQLTDSFGPNPGNLEMYSYIPSPIPVDRRPLVVVLHGCTQSAEDVAAMTGWNKLADSLHFFVLYPQTSFKNNVSRCFRWFDEREVATEHGECASILQMVKHFRINHPVDTSRIYITGLSAGGAMAVACLARYPNTFSSGAIIAGGPFGAAWRIGDARRAMKGKVTRSPKAWGDLVRSQNPEFIGVYPTISVYHGSRDKTVHPSNAEHLISQWTNLHGVDRAVNVNVTSIHDVPQVEMRTYTNKQGSPIAKRYVIHGLKHKLSINPGVAVNQGGEINKLSENTGFHVPWQCAVDFGLAPPQ